MATEANIIADLPELSWRGLTAPCEVAPYDFSHTQAQRKWPYIDGAGHDHTGRDPLRFTCRLYFINTLFGLAQFAQYPDNWISWREALFDGTAGELVHPDLGTLSARVLSGHVDIKAQTRNGIIVDVTFEEDVADPDKASIFTDPNVNIEEAAAAADAAMATAGISYPDGESTSSLMGLVDQVKGAVFSTGLTFSGMVTRAEGIINTIVEDVESLNDVSKHPVADCCRRMFAALKDFQRSVEKLAARSTATKVVTHDTTLTAFASEVGNTVDEIMGLNLSALNKPKVYKGTRLTYYT